MAAIGVMKYVTGRCNGLALEVCMREESLGRLPVEVTFKLGLKG